LEKLVDCGLIWNKDRGLFIKLCRIISFGFIFVRKNWWTWLTACGPGAKACPPWTHKLGRWLGSPVSGMPRLRPLGLTARWGKGGGACRGFVLLLTEDGEAMRRWGGEEVDGNDLKLGSGVLWPRRRGEKGRFRCGEGQGGEWSSGTRSTARVKEKELGCHNVLGRKLKRNRNYSFEFLEDEMDRFKMNLNFESLFWTFNNRKVDNDSRI
jgi:hypothetical protein